MHSDLCPRVAYRVCGSRHRAGLATERELQAAIARVAPCAVSQFPSCLTLTQLLANDRVAANAQSVRVCLGLPWLVDWCVCVSNRASHCRACPQGQLCYTPTPHSPSFLVRASLAERFPLQLHCDPRPTNSTSHLREPDKILNRSGHLSSRSHTHSRQCRLAL